MARRALTASAVVLGVAFIALALPALTRQRARPTSTPVPPALYQEVPVALAPGARACVTPVVVEPRTGSVSLLARPSAGGGPALRVTATAPGYASASTVPAGYHRGPVVATLRPPRRDVVGRLCVANAGRASVDLAGTADPRRATTRINGARAQGELGGVRVPADVVVTLQESRPRSLAQQAGRVVEHTTAFRPRLVVAATVAVLLVLLLVAVVAGAPWAYARALSDDRRSRPTE